MKLQSTKNKICPKHRIYKTIRKRGSLRAIPTRFWGFFIFSLVWTDHSRRNILHNFLQLWQSCAAFNCIRGTSCAVNADHVVVPQITFYLPVWEQLCSCSIPFPDLKRTCRTAPKDPELQQWICHLAKYCTSKEINLECYSWNVSKIWVKSSYTCEPSGSTSRRWKGDFKNYKQCYLHNACFTFFHCK